MPYHPSDVSMLQGIRCQLTLSILTISSPLPAGMKQSLLLSMAQHAQLLLQLFKEGQMAALNTKKGFKEKAGGGRSVGSDLTTLPGICVARFMELVLM